MGALRSDPELQLGWTTTANDVFKSRSRRRLAWSLVAAAGLHGMLFAWSPYWQREALPEVGMEGFGIEVLALDGDMGSSGAGATNIPGALVVAESNGASADQDPEESQGQYGTLDFNLVQAFRDRGAEAVRAELNRRAQPVPTLAEPEIAPEPDAGSPEGETDAEGGDEEGTSIGGAYALSEYEALTEDEILALERLSALRPELAFTSPSSWILIRNPSELTEFLEERFRGPEEGAVSVAIWVNEQGSVEWAEIQKSSGWRDLDQSALELFQEVVAFRPARQGGVNVPMALVFSVPFPW